jgi:Kef-type K+ transport system membrane component KefB
MPSTVLILLDILVILAAAWCLGEVSGRFGQPKVIGEIVAGIALGPTLLGHLTGTRLFPATMLSPLTTIADIGLVLYMFAVGMEVDQELVLQKLRTAAGVAVGATAVPFTLGCGVALWLWSRYPTGHELTFVLFFAVAVSATAFPVLARILTDRGMDQTLLGGLSLASAAIIDVVSYALLAIVVAMASSAGRESWRLLFAPVYLAGLVILVRPLLRWLVRRYSGPANAAPAFSVILIGLFASALATQWMQLNFIFGAFAFGAVMPRSPELVQFFHDRLDITVRFMLPVFFVVTGLTINLGSLRLTSVGILAVILAISVFGKVGGGFAGARLTGIPPRGSAVLGVLVNTRGLTELVILSVGLQQHLLAPQLYALLVIMAVVTTTMTGPLLNWAHPPVASAPETVDAAAEQHTRHLSAQVAVWVGRGVTT